MPSSPAASSKTAGASSHGMPNLSFLRPVLIFSCVPASTSGLTRRATGAVRPMAPASSRDPPQLLRQFDIELQDAGRERHPDLVVGLGDPGIDDAMRRHPGRQRPRDLAAGDRVGTQARVGEQPDDGDVAVGLDRVAEQHALAAERIQECLRPARASRAAE